MVAPSAGYPPFGAFVMNVSSVAPRVTRIALAASFVCAVPALFAQASPEELMANGAKAARLVPSATQLAMEAGKTVPSRSRRSTPPGSRSTS